MASFAGLAAEKIVGFLTAQAGSDFVLNAVAKGVGNGSQIALTSVVIGNSGPEITEQSVALKYPTVNIFCDKLTNSLKEKFRTFSGSAHLVVEIRHSHDQIQHMQQALENYVTATCQILDGSRGDWGSGLFYGGGYEVSFNPVKRGGKHFLQIARVALEVDISA